LPFRPDPFLARFEIVRRIRRMPAVGYGVAVATVTLVTTLRWLLGDFLHLAPFVVFYPAILATTLLGGVRAGALAAVLSAASADFFFLPPTAVIVLTAPAVTALVTFLVIVASLIGIVGLLNAAVDRLWAQAEATAFVLETEPAGVIAVDEAGVINLVNSAVERQLGFQREELLGKSVEMLVPSALRSSHESLRVGYMSDPVPRNMGAGRDLHAVRKDGSLLPVEVGLNPFVRQGRAGALATIIDVSERKALEHRTQLLANEVRHRSRNLLTVIVAVAQRTIPKENQERFLGVVYALSRTLDVLGARLAISLREIVESELAGFAEQVELSGCEVVLRPQAAQDFTLIVHELTTNALKYGALSVSEGRVRLTGHAQGGLFTFEWRETGGPIVAPSSRRGFGRSILQTAAAQFSKTVELKLDPEGLRYVLSADLARIAVRAQEQDPEELTQALSQAS
jgi:PAS domain S-box-containing protein